MARGVILVAVIVALIVVTRKHQKPKTKRGAWKNGLRYAFVPVSGPRFHVNLRVRCGFDDETSQTLHCAHFLEHMQASLTSESNPSAIVVRDRLAKMGAVSNAWTSENETCYWLEGPMEHADELISIFVASFTYFKMDSTIFEQERRAVLRELNERWIDSPWTEFDAYINRVLFDGHIRERHPRDHIKNVNVIDAETLLDFRRSFYVASNMFLTWSGPLPTRAVAVLNLLVAVPRIERQPRNHVVPQVAAQVYSHRTSMHPSARIVMVYSVPTTRSADSFVMADAMHLAKALLVGGIASRLYKRLRTELGLVYGVKIIIEIDGTQGDLTSFRIDTTCDVSNTEQTLDELLACVPRRPSEMELERLEVWTQTHFDTLGYLSAPKDHAKMAGALLWRDCVRDHDTQKMDYKKLIREGLVSQWAVIFDQSPVIFIGD